MLTTIALSLTLSLDAAAVAAAIGAQTRELATLAKTAVSFAVAQTFFVLLGAAGGHWMAAHLGTWAPMLSALLLSYVGVQMLRASPEAPPHAPTTPELLGLSVLISLDALAVGPSLIHLGLPFPTLAGTMFVVPLAVCALAGWLGHSAKAAGGVWAQRLGGLVLLVLAARLVWGAVG